MAKEEENSSGVDTRSRYLPKELQEETLVRLPITSVLTFKSVCKPWLSMFHSRPFTDLYRHHHRSSTNSYTCYKSDKKHLFDNIAPGLVLQPMCEEWSSCVNQVLGPLSSGIYCLTSNAHNQSTRRFCISTGKIALCNPSTRDCKLTNSFPDDIHSLVSHISSSGHPCRLHFGFGTVRNDYRVVVLVNYGTSYTSFVGLVYSVQSGEWKKIVDTDAFNVQGTMLASIAPSFETCQQRFFKGCWHWMAGGDGVLSFNFADEAFSLIGAPPLGIDIVLEEDEEEEEEDVYQKTAVFVLMDRHLAVIYFFYRLSPQPCLDAVNVWVMTEYGVEESWTRVYKINPNFVGRISTLVGIYYCTCECESGGRMTSIRINKISFEDGDDLIFDCDAAGECSEADYFLDSSQIICWNTPGISTFVRTLERL